MAEEPAFGESAVRALANAKSFARGRDYMRSGAVSQLVRRGDRLTAPRSKEATSRPTP